MRMHFAWVTKSPAPGTPLGKECLVFPRLGSPLDKARSYRSSPYSPLGKGCIVSLHPLALPWARTALFSLASTRPWTRRVRSVRPLAAPWARAALFQFAPWRSLRQGAPCSPSPRRALGQGALAPFVLMNHTVTRVRDVRGERQMCIETFQNHWLAHKSPGCMW